MRYPDFIEELLLTKAYTELTNEEKVQVSEWVADEEEYTKIRELLLGIESAFGEEEKEVVPAHIQATLEKTFKKKFRAKFFFTLRWQAVATITVAASLALIFYIGSLFTQQQKTTDVALNIPETENTKPLPKQSKAKAKEEKTEVKENVKSLTLPDLPKSLESIPPPPAINEVDIVEDATELEEVEVTDESKFKGDAFTAGKKEAKNYVNGVTVSPQKLEERNLIETLSVPQRSFSSPSAPISRDKLEEITSSKYYSLGSASLAENTDLLELGVEVY